MRGDEHTRRWSPTGSPGGEGMYQPLMTSRMKPFLSRRSRRVRLSCSERMATC